MNIVALESLLALFGFWVAIYYLWADYRNDSYREDIFSVRDEMFMYAAKGCIAFDHPAYTLLRARMNGLLRHGHELTLTRLLILLAIYDHEPRTATVAAWQRALNDLPDEIREKIIDFNIRTNVYVLQHLAFRSFFRYLVLRPLMHLIRIRDVMQKPRVATSVEKLETAALEEEEVSELATA
jgi:hypothetical protein